MDCQFAGSEHISSIDNERPCDLFRELLPADVPKLVPFRQYENRICTPCCFIGIFAIADLRKLLLGLRHGLGIVGLNIGPFGEKMSNDIQRWSETDIVCIRL